MRKGGVEGLESKMKHNNTTNLDITVKLVHENEVVHKCRDIF